MKKKYLIDTARLIIFVMLVGILWLRLSSAAAATKNELLEKPKEKQKNSFKRFEITYESIWLYGTFYEEDAISDGLGLGIEATLKYKNRVRNRIHIKTGMYKGAFYLTPRTSIAGAYARTYFDKQRPGWINMDSNVGIGLSAYDHISSDKITLWGFDFCQNIFTHKKTDIAFDLLAGYYEYTMDVSISLDYPQDYSDAFGGKRSFAGPHYGFDLRMPFTLPKLEKHPFGLKLSFRYMPSLTMKGKNMFMSGLLDPGFSSKGKGSNLEGRASLTFQITPNIFLEAAYNYYKFKVNKGNYINTTTSILGPPIPVNINLQKVEINLHGPSLAATVKF
ncbi:MAG: hypothetical protein NC936_05180 [Candidatus Omnitrophica bacterium]|nr:hypothetical protein [Candidatus Omnitrophota bacterium]